MSEHGIEFPEELKTRFAPEARLGAGAYGVVYQARDLELLRPVAVKLFSRLLRSERFLREAAVLATLHHENLVSIYQADRAGDVDYLVMELVDGEPLSRWARPGERDALPILLDIADALEEVHRAGLVHRDVKPGNVQVRASGRGVLLDLGCVYDASAATLTRTGMVLGTANYLPPEAFRGAPPLPAWDWYGWGVTLYACLEGETPYVVADLLEYASGGKLPPLRIGPATRRAGLEKLMRACLAPDDRDRPTCRADLEELAGARARPSTTSKRLAPASRVEAPAPAPPAPPPRRWWAPPIALLLLGMAALGWTLEDAPATAPAGPAAPTAGATPEPAAPELARPIDWARERGGPLPLPSPNVAVRARVAAPCRAENGEALVATGYLWARPGGGLVAQYGPQLLLYDEAPLEARTLSQPARAAGLLPGPGGALWALHPEDLETGETPPLWEPAPSPLDDAGCLELSRVAGDPEDPLAWQVAEVLLPPDRRRRMLPRAAGPWWVHDLGPDRQEAPRRLAFGRSEEAPRVHAFPEESDWWPSAPAAWDATAEAVVLAHRHRERGLRVRAVDPVNGAVRYQRRWSERREWGPAVGPAGLYLFDGEGVRLATRENGPDRGAVRLAEDPRWIPPHKEEGVRLLVGERALHVFVPHTVPPGTAGKDEPVLSWYRLAPDLSGPTPPRAWRLHIARPPEAVFIEQRVEVVVRPLPGRPDQALVAVQVGWSRYELLVLDLHRPRILSRVDVAPGDELTDSGYLRTNPLVTRRGGGLRVAWVDIWGVLKLVDLP